ncbi:hypothetical protein ACA910_012813 [Epithemia clementina (nom. ined.)]
MLGVLGFQEQSDAEKLLTSLIFDDLEHVLTSLQLNQLASFTYHERSMTGGRLIHERMLDVLEQVISRPLDVSVLAMHKALVVLRHLLLYGSEQVLGPARTLGKYTHVIEEKYNTALIAQQAAGATGFFMRLKGGAVDKGGPAREVAKSINRLFSDPQILQLERSHNADPESLVPVGSNQRVAFITDEARLAILKHRMERERQVILKSNLAKSDSAFGSGYTSKDGKAVVGAAHSLEEMIKEAEKKELAKKRQFTDVPKPKEETTNHDQDRHVFSDYQAPNSVYSPSSLGSNAEEDLLSFDASSKTSKVVQSSQNDFLSFAPSTSSQQHVYGGNHNVDDLLGLQSSSAVGGGSYAGNATADLLGSDFGLSGTTGSSFGNSTTTSLPGGTTTKPQGQMDTLADVATMMGLGPVFDSLNASSAATSRTGMTPTIMSSSTTTMSQDPFAGLDALNKSNSLSAARSNGIGLPQHQQKPQLQQPWQLSGSNMSKMGTATTGLDSLAADLSSISLTPSYPTPATMAPSLGATSFSRTGSAPLPPLPSSSLTASRPLPPPSSFSARRATSNGDVDDDDDDAFAMGGKPGSGLEPLGSAPAAPPPPPPPQAW